MSGHDWLYHIAMLLSCFIVFVTATTAWFGLINIFLLLLVMFVKKRELE